MLVANIFSSVQIEQGKTKQTNPASESQPPPVREHDTTTTGMGRIIRVVAAALKQGWEGARGKVPALGLIQGQKCRGLAWEGDLELV